MKLKILISFFLLLLLSNRDSLAQKNSFAVIRDKDGFTNIRLGKNRKIVNKLFNNQVFAVRSIVDTDGWQDWYWIDFPDYTQPGNDFKRYAIAKQGMINKSRIQYLSDLPQWIKQPSSDNSINFREGNNLLTLSYAEFIKSDHQYSKDKNGKILSIDETAAFGIDGVLYDDLLEIKSIDLDLNGQKIAFPPIALRNLLHRKGQNIAPVIGVAQGSEHTLFLFLSTGEGVTSYQVVWTIQNGKVVNQFCQRTF